MALWCSPFVTEEMKDTTTNSKLRQLNNVTEMRYYEVEFLKGRILQEGNVTSIFDTDYTDLLICVILSK